MMVITESLTPKQSLFVQEFLIDMNGTQAAIRSGYSARTANRIASENLTKPVIIDALQKAMSERAERTQISADAVLEEFAKIGFVTISDIVTWGEGSMKVTPSSELAPEVLAAIQEVSETVTVNGSKTIKVKLHPKLEALQSLGKHLQLFPSVTRHEGSVGVHLEDRPELDFLKWVIDLEHYEGSGIDLARRFAALGDDKPAPSALASPESAPIDADYEVVDDAPDA